MKCALPDPQLVPEDRGKLRVELQKQHSASSRKGMHRAVTLENQETLTPGVGKRESVSLICHLSVPREAGPELLGQLCQGTFLHLPTAPFWRQRQVHASQATITPAIQVRSQGR